MPPTIQLQRLVIEINYQFRIKQPCKDKSFFRIVLERIKHLNQITLNLIFHPFAFNCCNSPMRQLITVIPVLQTTDGSVTYLLSQCADSEQVIFYCNQDITEIYNCLFLSLMHTQTCNVLKGHAFFKTSVILVRDHSLESDKSHYLEWGEWGKWGK